jgi:hypothetical protein
MMTKKTHIRLCYLSVAISAALSTNAIAAELTNPNNRFVLPGVSQTDFGGVGLLQIPTARMADTGEFSANYRDNDQYRRYSVSLQLVDWLETTVRYTDVRTKLYSPYASFSGDQTYKDKAFDLKARLWQESYWIPQIAVGMRDIAGTGLFDSEYLAASKRIGAFDFTLGMGWGNMAESGNIKNPACSFSNDFCQRTTNNETGQFEIGNFFHGPAALYGGIEYQTPWNPLRIKLEYDGNDYSHETAGIIKQDSPINIGLVFRATDLLDTTLSYQRGNTLMWGFTLRTNFNDLHSSHIRNERPVYNTSSSVPAQKAVDWQKVASQLDEKAGYKNTEIQSEPNKVIITAEQKKYRDKKEAEIRAATILANHLPENIAHYEIINKKKNLPGSASEIDAVAFKAQQSGIPLGSSEPAVYNSIPASNTEHAPHLYQSKSDRLSYSAEPALAQSIGGAESFYMYQLSAKGNADLAITNSLSLGGTATLNIINNYNQFNYKTPPADGAALPRVRTWIREYVTSSDLLLTNLQLTHLSNPVRDWYSQAYVGYLEMMYAGTGSEVLYKPYGHSWAVGIDANYVKQRDWNDTLQLADYDVFTGHLTTYWLLPFIKGGLAKISAGQYLAGDKGVTLDLSRQFDSGIIAGAYVTKTNVSASDYGEGSFTKGFYISIPLDLMLVRPTTQTATISWVPLTRDGGQMLGKRYSLYKLTEK